MTLGNSCTKSGWWKHGGVHSWWLRNGRDGPWGKAPGATIAGGQASTKQAPWGRTWAVKPQVLNKPSLEKALDAWF
jgi:hypothetical protein